MDRYLRDLHQELLKGNIDYLDYVNALERTAGLSITPLPAVDNGLNEDEQVIRTIFGTELVSPKYDLCDCVRIRKIGSIRDLTGCVWLSSEWGAVETAMETMCGIIGCLLGVIGGSTAELNSIHLPLPENIEKQNLIYLADLKQQALNDSFPASKQRYISVLEEVVSGKPPLPPIFYSDEYPDEGIIRTTLDTEIRVSQFCDYIRICKFNGDEIVYWIVDEWMEAPEEVMGAITGWLFSEVGGRR